MLNILRGLTKAAVATVTLPVDFIADALTFGGLNTDRKETYTTSKVRKILDGIDEATD